jgi:hypothetical protein
MYNPASFVTHRELPNFTALFGNLSNSWNNPFPNDLYIKSVAKNIRSNSDLVQSAAGAPGAVTDLDTVTYAAGSFKAGQILDVRYGGFFNANDNNKNLIVDFGTANVETTGLIDIDDLGWQFFIRYMIVDPTTVRYTSTLVAGLMQSDSVPTLAGGFGGRCISRGGILTPANMDSNSQVLRVRGQGTALGDVTKATATIDIMRF